MQLTKFCRIYWEKLNHILKKLCGTIRNGRSVTDNIFALKIINKKVWKYNQSVQYLFIDFSKGM